MKAVPMLAEIVAYDDLKVGRNQLSWLLRLCQLARAQCVHRLYAAASSMQDKHGSSEWLRASDRRRCCHGCAGCA